MTPQADRNLLVGILALQLDFISRDQLIAAMNAWILEKATPLDQILRRQNALADDAHALLTALVAKHLAMHGGDPQQSLAAISSLDSLRRDLKALADPDIEVSLAAVPRRHSSSSASEVTETYAGDASAEGKRFRILRPHARGGLGEVFVAEDLELHREVALKEIQSHHADDPFSRSRFVLEAEVTGGLEHPGIVPVYGLGQYNDGRPFYAMRFIRGDSLKEAVDRFHSSRHSPSAVVPSPRYSGEREKYLSAEFRKLLGRFVDVCNAIEYAHSRGVLHRDLKPGNIMLGKYGETLVVDWGLAKAQGREKVRAETSDEATLRPLSASGSSHTRMGEVVGTPAYMSPEQAAGRLDALGPASDVYSLGATLYYLLTGQAPFTKDEHGDLLRRVERGEFPKPRSLKPEIPKPLEAICPRAMAAEARQRYASPHDLSDDVERYLADEPLAALPDSFGDRVNRFARRHRTLMRSAAAALVVVAIVSTIAALLVNEQRRVNAKLAQDKGQLAEEKGKLAEEKGALAEKNAALFISEREAKTKERAARLETVRQLRTANSLRLAAQSAALRDRHPQRAGLLAIAAVNSLRAHGEPVTPVVHESLLEASQLLEGNPIPGCTDALAVGVSENGRWLVTQQTASQADMLPAVHWTRRAQSHLGSSAALHLWDLEKNGPIARPVVLYEGTLRVYATALSANHRWLAAYSQFPQGLIHLWDLGSDDPAQSHIKIETGQSIEHQSISADGAWLLAYGHPIYSVNPFVRLVNLRTKETMSVAADVAALSSDGRWLVTNSKEHGIRRCDPVTYDASSPGEVIDGSPSDLSLLSLSPEGRWLIGVERFNWTAVWLWDLSAVPQVPKKLTLPESYGVFAMAFSRDGRQLALALAGADAHCRALVWNLPSVTGSPTSDVAFHGDLVYGLEFSPSGQWLAAVGKDSRVSLIKTGSERAPTDFGTTVLHGHDGNALRAVFAPDDAYVITTSVQEAARRWPLADSKDQSYVRNHGFGIINLRFDRSGRWLAATGGRGYTAWDAATGSAKVQGRGAAFATAFSEEGNKFAAATISEISIWETGPSFVQKRRIRKPELSQYTNVQFAPDGRRLVEATSQPASPASYQVRVHDLASAESEAEVFRFEAPSFFGLPPLVISSSRWLVTPVINPAGRKLGLLAIWDLSSSNLATTQRLVKIADDDITDLAALPDGRIALGLNGRVVIYDLSATDGMNTTSLTAPGMEQIFALRLSADGRWLAAACRESFHYNKQDWLGVFDMHQPDSPPRILRGHEGGVITMDFSPDNGWLATGSVDRTVRLWDMSLEDPSPEHVALHAHSSEITALRFTPDGSQLLTADAAGELRRWERDLDALTKVVRRRAGRLLSTNEIAAFSLEGDWLALDKELVKLQEIEANGEMVSQAPGPAFSVGELREFNEAAQSALERMLAHPEWRDFSDAVRSVNRLKSLTDKASEILAIVDLPHDVAANASTRPTVDEMLLRYRFHNQLAEREFTAAAATARWAADCDPDNESASSSIREAYFRAIEGWGACLERVDSTGVREAHAEELTAACEQTCVSFLKRSLDAGALVRNARPIQRLRKIPGVDDLLRQYVSSASNWTDLNLAYCRASRRMLTPENRVPQAIEGETLKILNSPAGNVSAQDMKGFASDRWSGDSQLYWMDGTPTARLDLELPVESGGKLDIAAVLTMAMDYGIVQLHLDDEPLGEPMDLYRYDGVKSTGLVWLGVRELMPGNHKLSLEIVGANPAAAKRHMVGLDYLILGETARQGVPQQRGFPKATASHTSYVDSEAKANDGVVEFKYSPHNRWTSYQSKTPTDWLQIEFEKETDFSRVELAIYDESPGSGFPNPKGGGVRTPEKYVVEYLDGEEWKPVVEKLRSPEKPTGGQWNEVKFETVKSKKVRVVFTHQGQYRSGVTEIAVWP